jgi:NADH-quinone oxidoreductase subunit E
VAFHNDGVNVTASDLDQEEQAMIQEIKGSLSKFKKHRGNLIPILQSIQEKHSYLASAAMEMVASHLDISPSEVYGVATF